MATDENRYVRFLTKKEARMADSGISKNFISYSTKDLEKIKPILKHISSIQGIKIFLAIRATNIIFNIFFVEIGKNLCCCKYFCKVKPPCKIQLYKIFT